MPQVWIGVLVYEYETQKVVDLTRYRYGSSYTIDQT